MVSSELLCPLTKLTHFTTAVTLDSPAPQLASAGLPTAAKAANLSRVEGQRASTAASLQLLASVRTAHQLSPTASPSTLLASQRPILYDDEGDATHPPTPPPPIAFLPQPDRPNPHLLSAALLQAIFLGASAMGLLMRKRVRNDGGKARAADDGREEEILDDAVVQQTWAKAELDKRRKEGESSPSDVPSLNLLLSAYAEVAVDVPPQSEKLGVRAQRKAHKAALRRRQTDLEQVASLLAQFDQRSLKPDHWTVLAVLAFANPTELLSIDAFEQSALVHSQLGLHQWAWKAYAELGPDGPPSSSPITPDTHLTILQTFLQFFDSPLADSLAPSVLLKRITTLSSRLLSSASTPSSLPTPPPALLIQLGLLALDARCTDVVTQLLINSTLPPRERQSLALAVLEAASIDEDWRQNRDLVRFVAETLVDATTELCTTTRKEDLDMPLVERASTLLMTGFGVDIPLEPFLTSLILAFLHLPDGHSQFTPNFLPTVLSVLVDARHPSSAYRIISLIPRPLRTTQHYYALHRSHHCRTSRYAWQELQERWAAEEIKPEVEAWEARMTGHIKAGSGGGMAPSTMGPSTRETNRRRAKEALEMAHEDLLLLQKHGIPRSTKLSNKLLRLSSKASWEPSWRRHVGRQWRDFEVEREGDSAGMEEGSFEEGRRMRGKALRGKVDDATRAIMLGRHLQSPDRGPRTSSYGRKQMAEVKRELEMGGKAMRRRFGGNEARASEEKVDILPNIVLSSLTRWALEVNTATLVKLARQSLNIDLKSPTKISSLSFSAPATLLGLTVDSQPIPTPEQFSMFRRPAYRTLLKALRNRGEGPFHRRLMQSMQTEERWVRRKARCLD